MSALGDLVVRIGAEISGFEAACRSMVSIAADTADEVVDKFESLKNIGASAALAGGVLTAGLTVPLVEAGRAAVETAANFETTSVAFTTLLHSGTAADQMLKSLYTFAAQTPFQIGGILQGARTLTAMGFEAKEIIPMMRTLGDTISGLGTGQEGLERLIYHMGQIQSQGHITGREIMEMGMQGINAGKMLADALGKTVPEITALVTKKAIDARTAIAALMAGMNKSFGGGMEAAMQTLSGMLSNLGDAITYTKDAIGEQLLPMGKAIATFTGTALEGIKGLAIEFGKLPEPVKAFSIAMLGLTAIVGPLLVGLGGITFAISSLAPVIVPIAGLLGIGVAAFAGWAAAIGVAIAALAAFAYWTAQHWSSVKAVTIAAWAGIKEAAGAFFGPTIAKLKAIWSVIGPVWMGAWNGIKSALLGVWGEISEAAKVVWGGITKAFEKFIDVARTIPGVAKLLDLGKTWESAEKLRISTEASTAALKKHGDQATITAGQFKGLADTLTKTGQASKIDFKAPTMDLGTLKDRNTLEQQHLAMLKAEAQLQAFNAGVKTGVFGDEALANAKKLEESSKLTSSSVKTLAEGLKILGEGAAAPFKKLEDAYKTLGVTSSESLRVQADEATKAYNTIKNSGTATVDQLDQAWVAAQEAQNKYNESIGKTIPLLNQLDIFSKKFNSDNANKGGIMAMFGSDTFSSFQSSFDKTITGLINGTMKFKNAFKGLASDMLTSWGDTLGKMFTQWISHLALKLARYVLTNLGILTSDQTTGAASADTSAGATAAMIMAAAGLAAANAIASTAAIPIIGPGLAPAAGIAAYTEAIGYAAVSAERGAVLPNHSTVGMLHPNEMVLPSHISKGLQGMIAGGGMGGGKGQFTQHNTYKGSPAMTKSQMDKFHKSSFQKAKKMVRERAI